MATSSISDGMHGDLFLPDSQRFISSSTRQIRFRSQRAVIGPGNSLGYPARSLQRIGWKRTGTPSGFTPTKIGTTAIRLEPLASSRLTRKPDKWFFKFPITRLYVQVELLPGS